MQKWFCERCNTLSDAAACSSCGTTGRPVQADDMVLLTTSDFANVDIVTGMLKSFDLDPLVQTRYGRGFVIEAGSMLETYRIYVPYQQYARARELVDNAWA